MRSIVAGLLLFIVVAWAATCQVPSGVGAGAFARLGVDARPLGMGGAFVAIPATVPIPCLNPASLGGASGIGLGGMYAQPYGFDSGITFQSISGTAKLEDPGSPGGVGVGLTWIGMQIADIPVWDEDNPGEVDTFTATSSLVVASIGLPIAEGLAVGGSARIYSERILEGRSQGLGFDVGIAFSFSLLDVPVYLGLNSMDVGRTRIRWSGTAGEPDNYVPWITKVGAAVSLFDGLALVACDFDWAVGRPAREQIVHLGTEVHPIRSFRVRAGYKTDLEGTGSFSAGLGLQFLGAVSVDYAFVPGGALGSTHFVSAHILF